MGWVWGTLFPPKPPKGGSPKKQTYILTGTYYEYTEIKRHLKIEDAKYVFSPGTLHGLVERNVALVLYVDKTASSRADYNKCLLEARNNKAIILNVELPRKELQ